DDNAYAMGGVAGHAGLFANAAEVDALAARLLACWRGEDDFVPREIVREFWTRNPTVRDATWALGWDTPSPTGSMAGTRMARTAVGHLGFRGTSLGIDLERGGAGEELFLAGRSPLVVAGTHGKTTSSAMLAWVLERTGRGPGFLVGGVPRELERSFALGRGPWFVIEGDEYDSAYFDKEAKFLHYRPAMLLLNAIEF